MIRGIHHAALCTDDLDRLLGFYRDVVGFEEVARSEWEATPRIDEIIGVPGSSARQVMLKAGGAYLELFQYRAPEGGRPTGSMRPFDRGYTHICLDVVDIKAEHARLTAAGASFNCVPGDFGAIKAVYGRDPDGNIIEIQETAPDHAFAYEKVNPRA